MRHAGVRAQQPTTGPPPAETRFRHSRQRRSTLPTATLNELAVHFSKGVGGESVKEFHNRRPVIPDPMFYFVKNKDFQPSPREFIDH